MKVLTIYAHPNPQSFCHAILEQFTKGLKEAGHSSEVIDLYAIGFDPVLKMRDYANWLPDENAPDVVERTVKERLFTSNQTLWQKIVSWFMFRNKSPLEIVKTIRRKYSPKDVRVQQEKVAQADALVFISPVWFVGFPAILKGWIERVFTLGFAYNLSSAGWYGDINGRIPLFKHEKALIINTTIFNEAAYNDGLKQAMTKLIDEFAFHYPGIKKVEHEYFHAVNMADESTLKSYLARAYQLGKEFNIEVSKKVII